MWGPDWCEIGGQSINTPGGEAWYLLIARNVGEWFMNLGFPNNYVIVMEKTNPTILVD